MTFLMILFVILCAILITFILIQQGKGDLGLGSLARSSQTLFGASGGQDFFEKVTWTLGGLFIVGALGLTILKSSYRETKLSSYQSPLTLETEQKNNNETKTQETK